MIIYEKSIINAEKEKEVLKKIETAKQEKKKITLYTFTRRFLDSFSCIDAENAPLILSNFWISGSIIYIKSGFCCKTISFDDIRKIDIA